MSERIAVVCARQGVDSEHVTRFMESLWERQPDSYVISGGADPEVTLVERFWLNRGGEVVSWRTRLLYEGEYAVERWEGGGGAFRKVYAPPREPTFADRKSAFHYRDMLIAEECDRLVAFFGPRRSRGAGFTEEWARFAAGVPTYEFFHNV